MLSSPGAVGRVGRVGAGSKPGAPPVVGNPPVNTAAPAITGTPTVGQTLTVSNGTWTNSPTGYVRQWTRDGAAIGGATGATYALVADDAGKMIGCTVTATNADGSNSAPATAVGPVAAQSARTYADWVAHAATIAPTAVAFTDNAGVNIGAQRTLAGSASGLMKGSSWASTGFSYGSGNYSNNASVMRHALASEAIFNEQVTQGAVIVFTVAAIATGNVTALSRNGFTSGSASGVLRRTVTQVIRWDFATGKAMMSDPSNQTGETEYTF